MGAPLPARFARREGALLRLVQSLGGAPDPDHLRSLYLESAKVFEDKWRRGEAYTGLERIQWMLEQFGIHRPADCPEIAATAAEVDQTLLDLPPALLPGVREALDALRLRYRLAIVSDTGFASGTAQTRLLEQDGLREYFDAIVYSEEVGAPKPDARMFNAALQHMGCEPSQALHVGDLERTDVAGALAVGMRAIRLDLVRASGESRAELVALNWSEVVARLR